MKPILPLFFSLLLTALSCSRQAPSDPAVSEDPGRPEHEECGFGSVYYWKTVLSLSDYDRKFLKTHNVERVYLRMFDVTEDKYPANVDERAVPNASLRVSDRMYDSLKDSIDAMEFVPVVYITLDALRAMRDNEGVLASNIVTRVRNMCSYNSIPNVHELQLDCDWTAGTERSFFALCDSVRHYISRLELPWKLSSTIRLHQLSGQAPPVDWGVLMVYNTGSFDDPDTDNSIIDIADIEPYLKHLSAYPLHLDVAYPTYSWQLLFRKRQFIGLISGLDLADTTQFARKDAHRYIARRDIPYNNRMIRVGDVVREETSEFKNIYDVKSKIESHLKGRHHSNILYHLDSANLSKYNNYEISRIFNPRP